MGNQHHADKYFFGSLRGDGPIQPKNKAKKDKTLGSPKKSLDQPVLANGRYNSRGESQLAPIEESNIHKDVNEMQVSINLSKGQLDVPQDDVTPGMLSERLANDYDRIEQLPTDGKNVNKTPDSKPEPELRSKSDITK